MTVDFSLYLITDRHQLPAGRTLMDTVEATLAAGVKAVQLREKDLPPRQLLELAVQLRSLTSTYKAALLINDRIDIAIAADADGVHLGEQSLQAATARSLLGADKLIGVSCHSLAGAQQAQQQSADFITFSPVFFTPSKKEFGAPQGLEKLAAVCNQLTIPVFALGGINAANAKSVCAAGAKGIALISAIIAAENPTLATRALSRI